MNTQPEESSGFEQLTDTRTQPPELYLIAHKVKGLPAFDIATQQPCHHHDWDANGQSRENKEFVLRDDPNCDTCDGLGYIWVIPTIHSCSGGWRAFPYWYVPLKWIGPNTIEAAVQGLSHDYSVLEQQPQCPDNWPDFYPEAYTMFNKKDGEWESPSSTNKITYSPLADALGLTKPKSTEPIRRI